MAQMDDTQRVLEETVIDPNPDDMMTHDMKHELDGALQQLVPASASGGAGPDGGLKAELLKTPEHAASDDALSGSALHALQTPEHAASDDALLGSA